MKYPIDVESFIERLEWNGEYDKKIEEAFRAFIPVINEAYAQGLEDAQSKKGVA